MVGRSMNFSEIKARIQALTHSPSVSSEARTLRTDVQEAWEQYVLGKLTAAFQDDTDEPQCLSNAEVLLRDTWPLIQGTSVSYTARPDSELTQVLVEIAKLISPNNPLEKLMPGIALESFSDNYPDLQDLSVEQVLKTYVLSGSSQYLYPVALIAELTLTDEKEVLPYNPYYDYDLGESDQQINPEEWNRLTTHSAHTEAVMQAKANYQALSTQNHHLLGQITTLIHQLALNDAHGGRGTSEDAAGQAYPALLQFKNYYETLTAEEISKVPNKIKDEISLLLDVAFNRESSVRAENPIQTCIGSRREALYAAMKGHEATLAGISMGEDTRHGLIEASKEAFDKAHDELDHALNNHTYTGNDNLGVTPALLKKLGVSVRIESLADMNFIVRGMDDQNLAELLAQDNVRNQIIAQVKTLEDLVILSMETSGTKLPIMLNALEEHVYELIKTPEDLAALLISLQVDRIEIMLQTMGDKFSDTIELGGQFGNVLRPLAVEQRTVVYEAMKDKLPDIIQSGWGFDLGAALRYCTVEQCTEIIDIIKNDLSDIFENGDEFQTALSQITPEQRTVVYEGMKDKFPDIIHDSRELGSVLRYLTPEQCTGVYEALKNKLPEIILAGILSSSSNLVDINEGQLKKNLEFVIGALQPDLSHDVYQAVKLRLPEAFNLEGLVTPPVLPEGSTGAFRQRLLNMTRGEDKNLPNEDAKEHRP